MNRHEMQMVILRALAELDVIYPNGYGYEEQAEHVWKAIETELGVNVPNKQDKQLPKDIEAKLGAYELNKQALINANKRITELSERVLEFERIKTELLAKISKLEKDH